MPMAPSFDTVGWFARDAALLRRIGNVYFGDPRAGAMRLLVAEDAFAIPVPEVAQVLRAAAARLGPAMPVTLYAEGVPHWLDTFRPLQLGELYATHGTWARSPAACHPAVPNASRCRDVPPSAIAAACYARELARRKRTVGHTAIL